MSNRRRPSIALEPRTVAHAEELFAVLRDPELYRFIEEHPPQSVDTLRAKIARSEVGSSPDGSERWLNWIVRDDRGMVAGYVQATVSVDSANIAYVFGTAFQGRGIATEAVARMLALLRADFGVQVFEVVAERMNPKSIRLAERLGFVRVAPHLAERRRIADSDVLLRNVGP